MIKNPHQTVDIGGSVWVKNGDVDKALRILTRKLSREGVFREIKDRRHFEKPSVKKRKKSENARKRDRKTDND